jgi:alkanesulfonate monooxygenase SsuD/methylene tetrahydromethanopterin reductase-like flavin-dependent oxidoreductase (luciferase family)
MELAVHLPLMQFRSEGQSLTRLQATVDAARECGYAGISANDHFVFQRPWLDGPTALASMIERSGEMSLATTVALAVLRGPVALAKALAALDILSGGRVVAAVGPGSSEGDYAVVGTPFEERWRRFDEALAVLRSLLKSAPFPEEVRYHPPSANAELTPTPGREIPLWVGSWGSAAGLARVARMGDGWLASAYNTTPQRFGAARRRLAAELEARGRKGEGFPTGLATMWTWVTDDRPERDRVLSDLAVLLKREPGELGGQVCIGSAERCAELLSGYAQAGCHRVYLWPLGDERRQLELLAADVVPRIVRD